MFELSIAWKYLLPKRRQLSVSIISLISVLVISLVIWLILVFFSVTKGLEKGWIEKLITLTAPIRITPTEKYYNSYDFQIDQYSMASNYALKTIGEKKESLADPYDPNVDEELPKDFPEPIALVKPLYQILDSVPNITYSDFELASANLRLRLLRNLHANPTEAFLSQSIYLATFEENNTSYGKTLFPFTERELKQDVGYKIPIDPQLGYGVIAPKSFKDAGVIVGDLGYISYHVPTASTLQEQRVSIWVAGFYDPGIVPMGGKFLLASKELIRTVRSGGSYDQALMTNGINVRFDDIAFAEDIKNRIQNNLANQGLEGYWKVESFRDFDYAKDLLQQLSSEKNIFSLISAVIIIVACSNIISMLIILVNDKRYEIGVLRAMGATSTSIALIFGVCGFVMGLLGTIVGSCLAFFTLRHLNTLLGFISRLQGYDAFNPVFYGEHLPSEMSYETLIVVFIVTGVISLVAGLVPAIKAARMRPALILRSE